MKDVEFSGRFRAERFRLNRRTECLFVCLVGWLVGWFIVWSLSRDALPLNPKP